MTIAEHVAGVRDDYDDLIYGGFHIDDPRDFFPDEEVCSPAEIECHRLACEAAARGEWAGAPKDGNTCSYGGTWYGFGLGTYVVHDASGGAS